MTLFNGLRDRLGTGDHIPLMCRSWNKPAQGYPELERLRLELRRLEPHLYWHLAETYFRPEFEAGASVPSLPGFMPVLAQRELPSAWAHQRCRGASCSAHYFAGGTGALG